MPRKTAAQRQAETIKPTLQAWRNIPAMFDTPEAMVVRYLASHLEEAERRGERRARRKAKP